jgi:uncharacterized membrane protein YkgB
MSIKGIDLAVINFSRRTFLPFARMAIFVIYFWFGILKLLGLSPATPLATTLTAQTVGLQYFDILFKILAIVECLIGVLFLIPKATRVAVPLLFVHMAVVSAPLLLIPYAVWTGFFAPTLEGQYIIKNIAVIAIVIGIAAQAKPLADLVKR